MKLCPSIFVGATLVIVAYGAHSVGYSKGLKDCPDYSAAKATRAAETDRGWAEIMTAPDSREATCDAIFDLVEKERSQELFDEQNEINQSK